MPRLVQQCVCLVILLLFVAPGFAQDASTGAIRGTVTDTTGSRMAGATLVFVSSATGYRYSAVSDPEGRFTIDLLPPGEYSGRAIAANMSPQVSPTLRVEVGGTVDLEFRLSIAGVKETVTVAGEPPVVDSQPSAVSAVVDERAISDLPLNGRRFTDLALLTPGVTQDPRGLTSSANGDLAFGGIRGYQSSYLVDGADNNNSFFGQARGRYRAPYQFSNEVVQEFRVSSNTYGAELGRSGGAVVNVVTKSGSNHVHGSAFYYLRDSLLDAQHPFMDFKPPSRQQQFGFTLGGPIKRNRVFFFAGYDQHILHVPTVVRFDNGNSLLTPQSTLGIIPGDYETSDQSLVFAAAQQLSGLAGNYPSKLLGNTGFLKMDFSLTPKNQLSARLSTSRYNGENNVFVDPASPLTTYGISDNGQENVSTETASLSLTSGLSAKVISHLRAQFSRDLQLSNSNSTDPLTRIYGVTDGFGRSSILPRQTREHKLHLAETFSLDSGRNAWKFGGDALVTKIYNFFPSLFGGEYYFDNIKVNPFTFVPQIGGLPLTPLRAYAHDVPRYYIQNFGSAVTHPDTNEYSWFMQDTARVSNHLAVSMGVRYDLQTFNAKNLVTNPLWPDSGKVPRLTNNFSPRIGMAYSVGESHPLIIRAGFGLFYTRIPQIYTSTVESDNGISSSNLVLNNTDFYDRQIFPQYPNPLVSCANAATSCMPTAAIAGHLQNDISAFASNFQTPKVEQASLTLEREMAHRLAVGVSYLYVHGEHLIRARDVNLPPPIQVEYPIYDDTGTNFLGSYYNVDSFSTWQMTRTLTCPFPPCINPLVRPIPQVGAINVYESAATSIYNGFTLSIHRRMTSGIYFRLSYTYAKAIDDGQDALVAGQPATVQNSYAPSAERGLSVTDQRNRLAFSWVAAPRPFGREHDFLGKIFNNWKMSGVITYGSGRPVDAKITGDANADGNSGNDRLPGAARNSFTGPDYATTDMRVTRRLLARDRLKLDLIVESFNLLNRDNQRVQVTDNGFENTAGGFVQVDNSIGINSFPAEYRKPSNFLQATDAYASRQMQVALKLIF